MSRPTSVTVIAWFLIVSSGMSLIASIATINNPTVRDLMAASSLPIPLQYAMTYVGLSVMIVAGLAMLNGRRWARVFYVGWSALSFTVLLVTSPVRPTLIPGLVVFALLTFLLFRPRVNQFFSDNDPDDAQHA